MAGSLNLPADGGLTMDNGNSSAISFPNFFAAASSLGRTIQLEVASKFLTCIAVSAIVLRMFSRKRFGVKFWVDDYCLIVASMLLLANQMILAEIIFLGNSTFTLLDDQGITAGSQAKSEEKRITSIVTGLKLYFSYEILYLCR
jgi:hypothetical protein